MLFDFLHIIESTGFAKRLSDNDWSRSEWIDSNVKSIDNLNCSEDAQLGHWFLGENHMILLQTVANAGALNFVQSFLTTLYASAIFMTVPNHTLQHFWQSYLMSFVVKFIKFTVMCYFYVFLKLGNSEYMYDYCGTL